MRWGRLEECDYFFDTVHSSFPGSTPQCSLGWAPDKNYPNDHTRPLLVTACTFRPPQVTHSTSRALGADPGEPRQSYTNVPGQTGVDTGKLNERTRENTITGSDLNRVLGPRGAWPIPDWVRLARKVRFNSDYAFSRVFCIKIQI